MAIKHLLELILLAALWGGSFLFMRIAAPVLGPIGLIQIRVLIAGLVLLPWVWRRRLWSQIQPHWLPLAIVGAINIAIPYSLFAFSALTLPAGFTSILNATTPLFAALLDWLWFHDRLTLSRSVGLVVGFCGVLVLVGWQAVTLTPAVGLAIAAGLSAATLYAIATRYIKQRLSTVPPIGLAAVSLLSAALWLLPLLPLNLPRTKPDLLVAVSVILLSVLSTSLATVLYLRLITAIGPEKVLTVTYLIPLFAIGWGAVFLGERLTLPMVYGCGLILSGTLIANGLRLKSK
jgi:drug/metabolite transporter (DMT)-like permease